MKNSDNAFAKVVACCCQHIVQMVEQFIQYLARNAYIIVALDGTPLIESGKKAFNLLKENLIDVLALNNVGDFVLFLGRIFVTLIAGFVSYEIADVSRIFTSFIGSKFNSFFIFPAKRNHSIQNHTDRSVSHICLPHHPLLHDRLRDDTRLDFHLFLRWLRSEWWNNTSVLYVS